LALKGIQAYNARDFFLAHEELETAWRDEKGPARDLYRGILQAGLAYYHILRGNYPGAEKMFQHCQVWLSPFPARYRGVDVEQLRADCRLAQAELLHLGPRHLDAFNRTLMRPVVLDTQTSP
jgi:uncharacterized protein